MNQTIVRLYSSSTSPRAGSCWFNPSSVWKLTSFCSPKWDKRWDLRTASDLRISTNPELTEEGVKKKKNYNEEDFEGYLSTASACFTACCGRNTCSVITKHMLLWAAPVFATGNTFIFTTARSEGLSHLWWRPSDPWRNAYCSPPFIYIKILSLQ